jgi:hypothetical protein
MVAVKNTADSAEKKKANNDESNHAWNTSDSGEAEETDGQPLSPIKRPRRTDNP